VVAAAEPWIVLADTLLQREALIGRLAESRPPRDFAGLARSARLDVGAAEVLALLTAVEVSPARQRLVAYVQDSVHLPRLTLATLARVFFEPDHPGERTLSPGGALIRARLARLGGDGPWATRTGEPAARVCWHLGGDAALDPELPAGAAIRPGSAAAGGASVAGAEPSSAANTNVT